VFDPQHFQTTLTPGTTNILSLSVTLMIKKAGRASKYLLLSWMYQNFFALKFLNELDFHKKVLFIYAFILCEGVWSSIPV